MKTFTISLTIILLLGMTAPPSVWSAGRGGGGGGHFGGFGGGALGHSHPQGREGPYDHGAMFDHERRFDRHDMRERFAYPSCFGYAYCASPVWPCEWQEGYWDYGVWVPPGCY